MLAADVERTRQEIQDRIDRGSDPVADATEAAQAGNFGLITVGQRGFGLPAGVTCFTPYRQAPKLLIHLSHGCTIGARVGALYQYAERYNRTIVARPDYPDADLCREAAAGDDKVLRDYSRVASAARQVATPPGTLHEAARRGDSADICRLLTKAGIDTLDGLKMTSLAWAVARNNEKAVELLLKAGANPWVGGAGNQDAVFFAARLGRRSYFERMAQLPGKPFSEWPASYLGAAACGGDVGILARILAQPHAAFRANDLTSPLPDAAALELILKSTPESANALMWRAAGYPGDRPDLIKLALGYGADPNAVDRGQSETVLGAFANGLNPASVEIVDMLLKAGADPNLISHWTRPIWIAVGTLKLAEVSPESGERATLILEALFDAGADINLPDDQNVPPAWLLLFPYRWDHEVLDASFVTPSLLEFLLRKGLDLNAQWQGKRILPLVESQAGADSELAVTLRRLGALH